MKKPKGNFKQKKKTLNLGIYARYVTVKFRPFFKILGKFKNLLKLLIEN